jgi:hypothetical protein
MTPDIEDPMAWLAFATDGSESNAVYMTDGEAQAAADAWGWQVMPLYLAPRLTDAERQAVEAAATFACDDGWLMKEQIATLRGLLERMSGNGDCRGADNPTIQDNPDSSQPIAKCDATPQADATPEECTVPTGCTEGGGK